nr:unnamed protein product [Digitaria exilis]
MDARVHHHHLRQLRAALLRRGHPIPPPPAAHPEPERAHLAAIRAAAASTPRLALAACACLRRAGLPPPGPRALPALLRSAARCDGAGAYVGGAHAVAFRVGAVEDGFVGTALVGVYVASGRVEDARRVFDEMPARDVVAWGVMLDSCTEMDIAEKIYNGMPRKDLVSSTAMVFGYAKNGKVELARSIFDRMPEKDVVSWSAMIAGYAESSLDKAISIHSFTGKNGLSKILRICNALIDMFAKCGGITVALNIFNGMSHKNVITWTSMIAAFAMHGDGKSALVLFEKMKNEGVEPNKVTFLNLLYACCQAGLLHEGRLLFRYMIQEYRIEPNHEHYGCMVDLLGRAKLLQEAVDLIESKHLRPNVAIWGSLLAACWMHGDLKLGAFAAKKVLELDPYHDGAFLVLSKIYAKFGNWNDAEEVRGVMKLHGVSKETGSSWMELNDPSHEFAVGGEKHPESNEILLKLNGKVS